MGSTTNKDVLKNVRKEMKVRQYKSRLFWISSLFLIFGLIFILTGIGLIIGIPIFIIGFILSIYNRYRIQKEVLNKKIK